VKRPSSPSDPTAGDRNLVPDGEELAIEVDALINELGGGVDTSSMEVEAVGPKGNKQDDEKTQEDDGFIALELEEGDGDAVDDADVDAIWSKSRGIDPEVHKEEIALVEAHAKAKMAAEIAQVKAQAAAERQAELDRLEQEAAAKRDAEVADARAQAEAAARESQPHSPGPTRPAPRAGRPRSPKPARKPKPPPPNASRSSGS
jgi:hypothetical protein